MVVAVVIVAIVISLFKCKAASPEAFRGSFIVVMAIMIMAVMVVAVMVIDVSLLLFMVMTIMVVAVVIVAIVIPILKETLLGELFNPGIHTSPSLVCLIPLIKH